MKFKKPVLPDENPFQSISEEFSTRIPMMKSITGVYENTTSVADVYLLGQRCPLPFNIFGLSTDDIPLYLTKKVMIDIKLKANWWRDIFSIVTVGNTSNMIDIEFLQANINDFKPKLDYVLYTGPAYQERKADSVTKYALGVPTVTILSGDRQEEVGPYAQRKVQQMQFNMENVPVRAYIYAKALYRKADEADNLREARLPDFYGRIESLNVKLTNTETRIASQEPAHIYDFCKSAGLNKSFEQACYLTGYLVCLDVSEVLST